MCEYCGCQALETIDELTVEHETVVTLISHVRDAHRQSDVARTAELAREIAAVLAPHTEVEEHGLFPALAGEFPDQIAALEAEHRRIEAVLGEAATGTPQDPAWPERLMETLALLREHILKEQDGVFPAALAFLDTEQWEAVEAVRARVGPHHEAPVTS
jgi:hemerythrin-like domain-containing protein